MSAINYVLVGHFAKDIIPDGGYKLGGTVFYSGTQAARLGTKVTVISSAGRDLDVSPVQMDMTYYIQQAPQSTTFQNIYDADGNRTQYVSGRALFLSPDAAPKLETPPTILHMGPLIDEVSIDYAKAFQGAMVCVTPQGYMRQVDAAGLVSHKKWDQAAELLSQCQAVVFSEEDMQYDETEIKNLAALCPISVCTRNKKAATLFIKGRPSQIPAYKAEVLDPTGAGDVFAAAFFIWLKETSDPASAVRFAHIAAAKSIEGQGIRHICSRDEILALYNAWV